VEEDLLMTIVGWLLGILSWVGLKVDPPNPFLHRKCPSTPACAVSKVNATVSKYAGERRNIEKSFGMATICGTGSMGSDKYLIQKTCNYWPSRLPIYLLLHMSPEINRSPKKGLFRKEGSLPSSIF